MTMLHRWKDWARQLKREVYALYLAQRDPRVPWYARLVMVGVIAYVYSPIDLIPDFIPVIGYLDDMLVVPLGIALVRKMIPPEVMVEYRAQAEAMMDGRKPVNWVAAVFVVLIWLALAGACVVYVLRHWRW